jgi:hypothetical protein
MLIQDLKKDMSRLDTSHKALRNFGLLFAGLSGIGAAALFWKGDPHWPWPFVAGLALFVAGLFRTQMLRGPYWLWMLLAFIMGWFMTRAILIAVYFLIMTPMGIIMRALGRDLLDERLDKHASSYWKVHEKINDQGRYKKQY